MLFIAPLSYSAHTEFVLYLTCGKGKYRGEADQDLHRDGKSRKPLRNRVFQKCGWHFSFWGTHSFTHHSWQQPVPCNLHSRCGRRTSHSLQILARPPAKQGQGLRNAGWSCRRDRAQHRAPPPASAPTDSRSCPAQGMCASTSALNTAPRSLQLPSSSFSSPSFNLCFRLFSAFWTRGLHVTHVLPLAHSFTGTSPLFSH